MRPLVLPAVVAGLLFACSSAYGSVGANVVGSGVDSNAPGRAQDYRVSADATGQVDRLSVYLDKTSTAAQVELGLFASQDSTHAGSRLGRCVITAPTAGAWNRCAIASVSVTSGRTYWLAVLQPDGTPGTIYYRNRSKGQTYGSSAVDSSGSPDLSTLPSPWSNGPNWGAQTASVYADQSGVSAPAPTPTPTPTPTPQPTPTPTPAPAPAPAPDYTPHNLTATVDSSGTVHLNWDDTTDPNFAWYGVRRSTDPNSDMATWTRLAPNYTTSDATDSGLPAGTYYYYVSERSTDGTISGRSNVASVTVPAAAAAPTPSPSPTPSPTPTATPTPPSSGTCPVATPNVPDGPDPWGGCFPGPQTTGVPAGVTLTNYTGPCTITVANTVIDSKTVNCVLNIDAKNVVIRNSLINGSVWVDDPNQGGSFTITDSTVDAGPVDATTNDGQKAIGKSHFTALRVETIRGVSGIFCEYDCTVKDSYVHGQAKDSGGHAHESGIRMGSGSASAGQSFIHNSIDCDAPDVPPDAGCSADLTGYGDFATIQNNLVENNLMMATTGGTCAYGGSTGGKPYPNGNNNVFQNNIFQHRNVFQSSGHCGYWYAIVDLAAGQRGNQWVNNRWDDGGLMPSDG